MLFPESAHTDAITGFEDIFEPLDIRIARKTGNLVNWQLGLFQVIYNEIEPDILNGLMNCLACCLFKAEIGKSA